MYEVVKLEIANYELEKAIREHFKLESTDVISYKIITSHVTNGLPGCPYETLGGVEITRRRELKL
jgi:hypothetical protein